MVYRLRNRAVAGHRVTLPLDGETVAFDADGLSDAVSEANAVATAQGVPGYELVVDLPNDADAAPETGSSEDGWDEVLAESPAASRTEASTPPRASGRKRRG